MPVFDAYLNRNYYLCAQILTRMHTREEKLAAFGRLLDIMDDLREKCPWDRKQTNESLRPNTIEETYELADALIRDDKAEICKELGDVLLHIVFYAKIGSETGDFDIADVCNKLCDKLIYRHPHVYPPKPLSNSPRGGEDSLSSGERDNTGSAALPPTGGAGSGAAPSVDQVLKNWEQLKVKEKDGNKRVLSGVPDALPSLIKAYRIQDKARGVGFDWETREQVWDKVHEELAELEVELNRDDKEKSTQELGDFLFAVINAARLYKLNPDNALELTNRKFIRRFTYLEEHSIRIGKPLTEMTLAEMDEIWNEAKKQE